MNALHDRIKEAREGIRLKKSDFASLVGVAVPTATEWESGKVRSLSGEKLLAIVRVTGVNPEWLLFGNEPKYPPTVVHAPKPLTIEELLIKIRELVQQSDTSIREDIVQMILSFIKSNESNKGIVRAIEVLTERNRNKNKKSQN